MKIKSFFLIILSLLLFQTYSFSKETEVYDIHQHYIPECYKKALSTHGIKELEEGEFKLSNWSIQEQLKFMDSYNIQTAFISLPNPYPYWGNKEETVKLVREINNEGAKIIKQNPKRFKLLATIPLPDVKNSINEIDYVYETLDVAGIEIPTNVDGVYLGNKEFEPIFKKLNEKKAVVFIASQAIFPNLDSKNYSLELGRYAQETAITIENLILSGTLEKYPDIKFVIPYGALLFPLISNKLESMQGLTQLKADKKLSFIKQILGKFYYDLAKFSVQNEFTDLFLNTININHLLYGSDYPYVSPKYIQVQKEYIENQKLLTKQQKTKIFRENIDYLFNKF